jgi:long-chain acyl-CoA synthetase
MSTFPQDEAIIISGGVTIRASAVEQILQQHPAVAQCAVLGIPDSTLGEAVHAIVIPKPGHGINATNLLRYCRQQLAAPYCPRTLEIREEPLPHDHDGKMMRHELRRLPWWEEKHRQRRRFTVHAPPLGISPMVIDYP